MVKVLEIGKRPLLVCRVWGQQIRMYTFHIRGFRKIMGTFSGSPYKKDYSIWGSILGSPYLGKLPFGCGGCVVKCLRLGM